MKQVGMTWNGEAATKQEPLTEWLETKSFRLGIQGKPKYASSATS